MPASVIEMDFNPLIESFNLRGAFCLIHWQAKPFGLRKWGVFCHSSKRYYSSDYNLVQIDAKNPLQLLQIDEKKNKQTRPTAVLYIANARVTKAGDKIIVS